MFVIFILGYINEEFEEDGSVGYLERIQYIVNAYNLFVGIFTGKKTPSGNQGVGRRVL
jgi:hypothetical protein